MTIPPEPNHVSRREPIVRRSVRALFVLPAICATVGLTQAGCRGASNDTALPRVSAIGSSSRVLPGERIPAPTSIYRPDQNVIPLVAARGEVVSFIFVLSAADGEARGLRLSVDDLSAAAAVIPRDRIRMYRHWPVTVSRYPNWYLRSVGLRETRRFPDALVPIDAPKHGQPFALETGESLNIRVEIRVPSDAVPGRYDAHITVEDDRGRLNRTPIELDVRDIVLAQEAALDLVDDELGLSGGVRTSDETVAMGRRGARDEDAIPATHCSCVACDVLPGGA